MELYEIIRKSAEKGIKMQRKDGSMPPGHNGPYKMKETPVRNTSHWTITFLKTYEHTKEEKYLNSAKKAVDYLLSDKARPYGYTFKHLDVDYKIKSNGLIGQSWTLEALLEAKGHYKKPEKIEKTIEEILSIHPFDEKLGIWKLVDIKGDKNYYQSTFNHQLWFATMHALFGKDSFERKAQIFMDRLDKNLNIYSNGLIYQGLLVSDFYRRFSLDFLYKQAKERLKKISKSRYWKSVGYHSFNMYAFALLKQKYLEHDFWESEKFEKIIEYSKSKELKEKVRKNKFGLPYNPAGFEIAFALNKFEPESLDEQKKWISMQLKEHFDWDSNLLNKNTINPKTLSARIYEATRLPNYDIEDKEAIIKGD